MSDRSIPTAAFVSHDSIAGLPDHGLIALASRQVARNLYLLSPDFRRETFDLVRHLQEVSRLGHGDPLLGLSEDFCARGKELRQGSIDQQPALGAIADSLYELGRVTRCVWADSYEEADAHCVAALVHADAAARHSGVFVTSDILVDVEAARVQSARMMATSPRGPNRYGRRRRQSFPQDIFAEYQSFDLSALAPSASLIEVISPINEEVIARLSEQPTGLYQLSPRAFEELIAKVFDVYGFSVELTAPTRDMGRDVVAVSHRPAEVKYLIECKKYARENKVGIAFVQRLHGVLHGDQGTRAVLATTGAFTAPAQDYMRRPHVQLELEGRDFAGIHGWLLLADRIAVARRALGSEFRLIDAQLPTR